MHHEMEVKDFIFYELFEKSKMRDFPIYFFLLREVEPFYDARRIEVSSFHRSTRQIVGVIRKPIFSFDYRNKIGGV